MDLRFHYGICVLLVCAVPAVMPLPATGRGLLAWEWRFDTLRPEAWQPQPAWLAGPSTGATCTAEGDALCFSVPDAHGGMKWSQGIPGIAVADRPFLVLRYRADGALQGSDDYLVYVDGMDPDVDRHPVRLRDAVTDGQWRTVAVYLPDVTHAEQIRQIAVQVRAGTRGARLWIGKLVFAERLPEGAERLHAPAGRVAPADRNLDLLPAAWHMQPSWLGNPDGKALVSGAAGDTVTFGVATAGRGMKWQRQLETPLSLDGYAYAVLRYRATATADHGDYTVCLLGKGGGYEPVVFPRHLRHDGRVHTVTVALGRKLRELGPIAGIAVQAQAASDNAMLDVLRLGFSAAKPRVDAREYLVCRGTPEWRGFEGIRLTGRGKTLLREALDAANVTAWPGECDVMIDSVPFALPAAAAAIPMSGIQERREVALDVRGKGSQIFLLVMSIFRGAEEAVYGRGQNLTSIPNTDRFGMRVEYADGTSEACFPYNVSARAYRVDEGAQVLCVFTDAAREAERIVLRDDTSGGAFVVLALTIRRGVRVVDDPDDFLPDFRGATRKRRPVDANDLHRFFGISPKTPDWRETWTVTTDGRHLPPTTWREERSGGREVVYGCDDPPLRLTVTAAKEGNEFALAARVTNHGKQALRIGLVGPKVGPAMLGDSLPENQWYMYPRAGAMLGHRPFEERSRYGGHFPLQFMAAFNPVQDEGVYLRTVETSPDLMRDYCMRKTRTGTCMWVEYPEQHVTAGQSLRSAATRIGVSGGDWRAAFGVYRDWLRTWYRPHSPRKRWFREVFNFRQRFLHAYDPLYDATMGTYDLQRALIEAEQHFGGMEYMHIFDWGRVPGIGRVYGRTGDQSPFDGTLKGGTGAFREAISAIQGQGVRVGLYIEGYLLQEKGRLGQAYGKDWQIVARNGMPLYWPDSSEMMICSHVPAWRDVQADTYATRVRELGVDGMYLDQFGFANVGKDCWSKEHGHPVPGCTVAGEFGLAAVVRRRMSEARKDVALYTEEVPCDVNSQLQDGSFSYHMRASRRPGLLAPFHPLRFAVPSFKTFEILVCDQPMGSWAEGVKWTFFNGEGIWLEGPAREWFLPETLATIRKCHGILREYRDAFVCDDPVPLEPTCTPGVFANVYPGKRRTVMTLYNARHRTVRAAVPVRQLDVPPPKRVRDVWNGTLLTVRKTEGLASVVVTLGPRDVGCIVFD